MIKKKNILSQLIPIKKLYLILAIIFVSNLCIGQENDSLTKSDISNFCEQQDIRDLLRKKNKTQKPERKTMLLVLPSVTSNPTNGLMVGVSGTMGWYFGPKETTRVSSLGFTAVVTTENQFISYAKTNIYTNEDRFFLQGDWRYYIYNAYTWGLGTNSPDTVAASTVWSWLRVPFRNIEEAYPMSYNYLKLHEVVNYKIAEYFYGGIGYHLDHYDHINDQLLGFDSTSFNLTPHYLYSTNHGFDPTKYTLSGLSLNFVYDSRDNLINPYKGYFVNLNYRYNPTFLGSDQNSSSLYYEFRTYVSLSKKTARHLIAFWTLGKFVTSGNQPYLTLMATGEDQKGRSGRAYVAGRYRGEDMLYGEVEYRFPISQCSKIIGGVIFVNATTTSNRSTDVKLFTYVRPAVGFGFRFMLNKHFRTNINLDFGLGYQAKGLYFSGTETF